MTKDKTTDRQSRIAEREARIAARGQKAKPAADSPEKAARIEARKQRQVALTARKEAAKQARLVAPPPEVIPQLSFGVRVLRKLKQIGFLRSLRRFF
jgi:hypothetical protein